MTIFSLRRQMHGLGLSPKEPRRGGATPIEDTEAPSVPQNLSATAVSSSQIDLSWDASTDNVGVTGYSLYRDNVLVGTSLTNAYSDTGLAAGTLYQYEVSAFDAASNESARSAPASATTHQAIVTAGLLAEWRFDDGSGQQITDYRGNGFHAQLGPTSAVDTDEPTWSSTGVDCVVSAPENFITTGSTLGISGTGPRTVVVVGQADLGPLGGFAFLSWVGTGGVDSPWSLSVLETTGILGIQILNLRKDSSLAVTDDGWHFMACACPGPDLQFTMYLDDASEAVASGGFSMNTAGNVTMATRRGVFDGFGKAGKMAYALVYDRALTAEEIEQNRQALKTILAGRGITLP
jgi:hypothetical protein